MRDPTRVSWLLILAALMTAAQHSTSRRMQSVHFSGSTGAHQARSRAPANFALFAGALTQSRNALFKAIDDRGG